ncbi:hypothetical protein EDE15_2203 [Edaphobacter aggregans]|uniref:DUF1772 domain-containing protein n=1 Tax=Edaphobacter aggregans TaxID=570835 RepID=A0A428MIH0_9BACT|nr:hypothetical protein [Edaphobacter aggregans]RSL16682.1 hypothetical protein EDE15_2203 [Edaphobacter aggregans]
MERRSFLFANLTVLFAAIVVSTSFGASLVETVIHMSRYFADPPASFATWYGDQSHTIAFWMPLQVGGLILLIAALVANWRSPLRKRFLAVGLAVYVAIAVWNGAYFATEVRWLLRVAQENVVPADFVGRAHRWYLLTWVRQVAMAVPFFAVMMALMTPASASGSVSQWRAEPAVG